MGSRDTRSSNGTVRIWLSESIPSSVVRRLRTALGRVRGVTLIGSHGVRSPDVVCVLATFNEPEFNNLHRNQNARIIGLPYLNAILSRGDDIVKVLSAVHASQPLLSDRFKGEVFTTTEIRYPEKDSLTFQIKAMGGTTRKDLSRDTTYLIARQVGSAKYYAASAQLGRPIVFPEWVRDLYEEPDTNRSHDDYLVPCFAGIRVSVTGLTFDDKAHVKNTIEANGGTFCKDLDRQCTHLIAAQPSGQKFEFARNWGTVKIVKLAWLSASLKANACQDEVHYLHEGCTPVVATAQQPVLCYVEGDYFDGCRFYLAGFDGNDNQDMIRLVRAGCGLRVAEVGPTTTHIVVASGMAEEAIAALHKQAGGSVPLVTQLWLEDSASKGERLEVTREYNAHRNEAVKKNSVSGPPVTSLAKMLSGKANGGSRGGGGGDVDFSDIYGGTVPDTALPGLAGTGVDDGVDTMDSEPGGLTLSQQLMARGDKGKGKGKSIQRQSSLSEALLAGASLAASKPAPAPPRPTTTTTTSQPKPTVATTYDDTQISTILGGVVFGILDRIPRPDATKIRAFVKACGGRVRSIGKGDLSLSQYGVDVLVVPDHLPHGAELGGPNDTGYTDSMRHVEAGNILTDCTPVVVTQAYIEACHQNAKSGRHTLPLPRDYVAYLPRFVDRHVIGSKEHSIALTMYSPDEDDRAVLEDAIAASGAHYSEKFSKHNTVLICGSGSGPKFDAATKWHIPTVSHVWLLEALRLGSFPPVSEFSVTRDDGDGRKDDHEAVAVSQMLRDKGKGRMHGSNPNGLSHGSEDSAERELLAGCLLHVTDIARASEPRVPDIISRFGGKISSTITTSVTHIVHSGVTHAPLKRALAPLRKRPTMVSPYWLIKCGEHGYLLDPEQYPPMFNPAYALVDECAAPILQGGVSDGTTHSSQVIANTQQDRRPRGASRKASASTTSGPARKKQRTSTETSQAMVTIDLDNDDGDHGGEMDLTNSFGDGDASDTGLGTAPMHDSGSQTQDPGDTEVSRAIVGALQQLLPEPTNAMAPPRVTRSRGLSRASLLDTPASLQSRGGASQATSIDEATDDVVQYDTTSYAHEGAAAHRSLRTRVTITTNSGRRVTAKARQPETKPLEWDKLDAPPARGTTTSGTGGPLTTTKRLSGTPDWTTALFQVSGFTGDDKKGIIAGLRSLGGKVNEASQYHPNVTHIIVRAPSRTEKYLAGCAAGKWLLRPSFVTESVARGDFVDPHEHEWDASTHTGSQAALYTAATRWRCSQHKCYEGMRALLLVDAKKADGFLRLLRAGGGEGVIATSAATADLSGITHAFVQDDTPLEQVRRFERKMRSRNVPILRHQYIIESLTKYPVPDQADYQCTQLT